MKEIWWRLVALWEKIFKSLFGKLDEIPTCLLLHCENCTNSTSCYRPSRMMPLKDETLAARAQWRSTYRLLCHLNYFEMRTFMRWELWPSLSNIMQNERSNIKGPKVFTWRTSWPNGGIPYRLLNCYVCLKIRIKFWDIHHILVKTVVVLRSDAVTAYHQHFKLVEPVMS